MEYRNRKKDGTPVDVIAAASPILDDHGDVTGFIAVQQDVTEQNLAAEEQRRLAERVAHLHKMESLGTLAGGLAHDFNNILSIILCHTSLLERKPDDPRVVARVVGTVQQAVQRGAGLARQILTFASRAEIKAERMSLTHLIHELGSMISETFPRTIAVTLDLEPDLPLLSADAGQIHQALLNLCVNARDAMPGGGDLTIAARRRPAAAMTLLFPDACAQDYVEISVRDTGTGIDKGTLDRIFEPFFTTKEKGKGTGLGLATVYGVANNHGGLVDVDSRVGEGTTFRMYLPVRSCQEAPPVECHEQRTAGSETLLLVDDEPAVLDAIGEHLRAYGYQVHTAENGPQAIEKCRLGEGAPDAVVMDLGMPRMSPAELLRELRAIAPTVPVLAMTGYIEPDVHAAVEAAGVQRILAKPFEMAELLGALRDVL
jgi:signal transduction histidine kinase